MTGSSDDGPRWARRLVTLCAELRAASGDAARNASWEEAWVLLGAGLLRYLRVHAARVGPIPPEELEDLAASKSLDLIERAVSGVWNPSGRTGAEVAGYLSTVARNGLVDWARRGERLVALPEDPLEGSAGIDGLEDRPGSATIAALAGSTREHELPDLGVQREEFVCALLECAGHLTVRARRIWFLRMFYEMASREIAAHPDVGLRAAHVDVLISRSRQSIRDCMCSKGHRPDAMPPGVFVALWHRFRETDASSVSVGDALHEETGPGDRNAGGTS